MKKLLSIFSLLAIAPFALPAASGQSVARPEPVGERLTKVFPYSMAGQLLFKSGSRHYLATGTVVHQRSVLTAAHNLWSPETGWSTEVRFNRARNGSSIASRDYPTRMFVFASYRSSAARYGSDSMPAFAADFAGLRFKKLPADGMHAGWKLAPAALTGGTPATCLGYGASVHTGNELLSVSASTRFLPTLGPLMENFSLTFEQGMSGGPVLAAVAPDDWRVVGVVVAGSDSPPAGAIRAIDESGAAFLEAYLSY
jgi:V8-like Glu-specific endopeptidase